MNPTSTRSEALTLTSKALSGVNIKADALRFDLLALTQVASALRRDSTLTVFNGDILTPMERSCIVTATSNQVRFE